MPEVVTLTALLPDRKIVYEWDNGEVVVQQPLMESGEVNARGWRTIAEPPRPSSEEPPTVKVVGFFRSTTMPLDSDAFRNVRMSVELMEQLFTRDADGNRLRVNWREPDAEGFYTLWITVDHSDNIACHHGED